jgi:hypothetical protein
MIMFHLKSLEGLMLKKLHQLIEFARKHTWQLLIVSIFAICLTGLLGFNTVYVNNNTDSSWQYTLSGLRHSPQNLGVDVFFTYGPLFERMVTFVHHNDTLGNYVVSSALFLYIFFLSIFTLWRFLQLYISRSRPRYTLLFVLLALSLFLSVTELEFFFAIYLLITIMTARKERKYVSKLLLLSGVYLLSLYKFNLTFPAVFISYLAFVDGFNLRKLLQSSLSWLGSLGVFVTLFFLVGSTFSFPALIHYFHYGITNSLYYGEFMSLAYPENLNTVILYTIFFLLIGLAYAYRLFIICATKQLPKSQEYIVVGLAFVLIAYFTFKHAVIRSDVHLLGFSPILFPGLLFIYLSVKPADFQLSSQKNRLPYVVLGLFVLGFIGHVVLFHNYAPPDLGQYIKSRTRLLDAATLNNRLNYNLFKQNQVIATHDLAYRQKFVQEIKGQLDAQYPRKNVIFYGNTTVYGDVLSQNRAVSYLPFLQNYSANPPSLFDKLYISYLEQHPNDLVFAEETEPSVDNRIPSHELNDFFQYLLHNYKVVLRDNTRRQYVFQRVSNQHEQCQKISELSFKDDVVTPLSPIPAMEPGNYAKLVLDSEKHSPAVTLASAIIKKPVYTISLITPDGIDMKMRTTPAILEHGVAIKPLYLSLGDHENGTTFNLGSILLNDGAPTRSSYTAQIQTCQYK